MISVDEIRKEFPILSKKMNHHPLIYLDNAATTQMPLCVLERIREHYLNDNANVHRGIYSLSERATNEYEAAREVVCKYLGAEKTEEIIFTQGTTDAVNMVADGLRNAISQGDSIVVTELEHHSNFLPWQRLCHRTGALFKVVPCPDGNLDMEAYKKALEGRPKIVAMTQVSNLTGTKMPLKTGIRLAHDAGAMVLVDGAQGIRHCDTNVLRDDIDFYCFSGHKIMGPTGIGVLYGKSRYLNELEPVRVGGGMVDTVTLESFSNAPLPSCLEAGTPNYPGAIALAEALYFIEKVGREEIAVYENALLAYAQKQLFKVEDLEVVGHPAVRAGVISFTLKQMHSYDAASILDQFGVAVRSGTHCAQVGLARYGHSSVLRLSPAFYNTYEEIDQTCAALEKTKEVLKRWMKK